jgi:two-component sensor histidine kinase
VEKLNGEYQLKPPIVVDDRGAMRQIFRLLCFFAVYLVVSEIVSDSLKWGKLTHALLQFVPYCIVLGTVLYTARTLVAADKQVVLMGLCLACVFIVLCLDLTKNLVWLDAFPILGIKSGVRPDLSSLANMIAIASFPAASYFMIEQISQSKAKVDEQLQRLQEVEKALTLQQIELARLYEQTREDAETKTELLREINHRVQNNLVSILGLIQTQHRHAQNRVDRPVVKAALERLSQQVRGLIEVHQMLSRTQWRPMLLSDLAHRIITAVTGFIESGVVKVDISPSPILVSPRQANSIGLALNELATNTVKHATLGRALSTITVRIHSEANQIQLEYQDDGPGFPPEILNGLRHGVGLVLLQQLAAGAFRGNLTLSNEQGAKALISIKNDEITRT